MTKIARTQSHMAQLLEASALIRGMHHAAPGMQLAPNVILNTACELAHARQYAQGGLRKSTEHIQELNTRDAPLKAHLMISANSSKTRGFMVAAPFVMLWLASASSTFAALATTRPGACYYPLTRASALPAAETLNTRRWSLGKARIGSPWLWQGRCAASHTGASQERAVCCIGSADPGW